jgi:hypothetical protein
MGAVLAEKALAESMKDIRDCEQLIDAMEFVMEKYCPVGPVRDQIEANLLRFRALLLEFQDRVAAHGPFLTAEEARSAVEIEEGALFAAFSNALN